MLRYQGVNHGSSGFYLKLLNYQCSRIEIPEEMNLNTVRHKNKIPLSPQITTMKKTVDICSTEKVHVLGISLLCSNLL